jgi:hypothetical protein
MIVGEGLLSCQGYIDPRIVRAGRLVTDLAARVGWLPALDDILHPDGNAGFDALMRQNVEPVVSYGVHGRGGNVRVRQFTRFDRLTANLGSNQERRLRHRG